MLNRRQSEHAPSHTHRVQPHGHKQGRDSHTRRGTPLPPPQRIANHIRPIEQGAKLLLLLGRDIMRVHKVRKQHNGPHNAPYAQRLDLG
ncbi:hypothetical protein FKM82_025948 [Ascaphus truei]